MNSDKSLELAGTLILASQIYARLVAKNFSGDPGLAKQGELADTSIVCAESFFAVALTKGYNIKEITE